MTTAAAARGAAPPVQAASDRAVISAEWARVGGGFTVVPATQVVDLEQLIVRSAEQGSADARLFFVAATWVGVHHELVDARRLARALRPLGGLASAAAGALLDAANTLARVPRLTALAAHCRPLAEPRALFDGTAADQWLTAQARRDTLPLFARWGLWCDDLSLKPAAVRPVRWVLRRCPELRVRALLGASLDAAVVVALLPGPASVAAIARAAGATYAATHEAVARLLGRGVLAPADARRGGRVAVAPDVLRWLEPAK